MSYPVKYYSAGVRHVRRNQGGKYPFHDCDIGDSFFVPLADAKTKTVRSATTGYASHHKPLRFSCKFVKDYESRGPGTLVRVVQTRFHQLL